MNNQEFEKKMENLSAPSIRSESTKQILKITLLNARKTANVGLLLLILPFIFVFGNIFKYELGIELGFITSFLDWLMSLDQSPVINWIIRFFILGAPAIAALANLLAITHFFYEKESNQFIISVKLKWINIAVILFCSLIVFVLLGYLIVENVNHP